MSKFNLIDEPWISVINKFGTEEKLSIKDILKNAANYMALAGECIHQDIAIIRLLSALTVTILYRYGKNGKPILNPKKEYLLDIFRTSWNEGIPEAAIDAYLNEWHDRFFLLDDKHPFYQVSEGTFIKTEKKDKNCPEIFSCEVSCKSGKSLTNYFLIKSIMGTVRESNNSKSPFSLYRNTDKLSLTYDEAARWLIWYMNFASCASKSPKNYTSKMTWASGGALLIPQGENLLQTILLNSVMFEEGTKGKYKHISPVWERDTTPGCEFAPYGESGYPDNLPELYTQQSRKIRLHDKNGRIDGLYIVPGDYYGKNNAFLEPMFMWRKESKTKDNPDPKGYVPKNHSQNAPAWMEFDSILPDDEDLAPGCIKWINCLYHNNIISRNVNIPYQIIDELYGNMQSSLDLMISANIVINRKFFNPDVADEMEDSLQAISDISSAVFTLSKRLAMSAGMDEKRASAPANKAKQEYQQMIGHKVDQCLSGVIDIETLDPLIFSYANKIKNKLLDKIQLSAFHGHNGCSVNSALKTYNHNINNAKKRKEVND